MYENIIVEARELTNAAYEAILADNITTAKKILNKIRHLMPMTETSRAITFIEAAILLQKKKKRLAKNRILQDNYGTWGSPDLLYLLRLCNPPVSPDSKIYRLTLRGGYASFGFTCFSDQHQCNLEVIAGSQHEAQQYISELCNLSAPETAEWTALGESPLRSDEYYRGVTKTSPFTLDSEDESCDSESEFDKDLVSDGEEETALHS